MIVRVFFLLALLPALFMADGVRNALSQKPDPEAIARAYLERVPPAPAQAQRRAAPVAVPSDRGIVHTATQESQGAYHVRFQETESGVPVFGGSIVVNVDKDTGDVGYVSDRRTDNPVASGDINLAAGEAVDTATAAVGLSKLRQSPTETLVYYPIDGQLYLAWQVLLPALDPLGDWLVIVRTDTGEVVMVNNVMPMDTGRVFDPNPVATNPSIPPPSNCDSSANESNLSGQYRNRTLLGINGGQSKLKGQYVDLTAPGVLGGYKSAGLASSASHTFTYTCNQDAFEEVMVYYHVDTTQRRLQALGFTGTAAILDEPIPAHAHYMSDCNAFFSPIDAALHFGDSSATACGSFTTDTAEDADVIIHEYGHAIQSDQVPGWGFGDPIATEEARGMGEGFGDFLAAAMTGSPCIGDWVNFGQTTTCAGKPGLRYLQNNKTYPSDFNACPNKSDGSEEEHCTGAIWGGALWDLVEAFGSDQDAIDLALTLVVDSHFYLGPAATFDDAVCAIFAADDDLFGGAHGTTIANVFSNRGISCTSVPPPDFPYAFFRIRHTAAGNLTIRLKAGSNPNLPDCNVLIWDHVGGTSDDVVGYVGPLDDPGTFPQGCVSAVPPSASEPWWLEVQDTISGNTGTIEDFEIALSGTKRCIANDVPIAIPDGSPGAVVRSKIDCADTSGAIPGPGRLWYFAEGFTGDGYLTFISLMNPGDTDADVTATFNLDGASPLLKNIVVPAHSRRTIPAHDPSAGPGPGRAFGIQIESDEPIVAQEVLVQPAGNLAHATIGSKNLSTDWYFAEGFTGDGYLTFISLMNPGNTDANVTATFNLDGASPLVKNLVVPAHARRTIPAHDPSGGPGPGWAFGVKLTSDQPVMAQEVLVQPSGKIANDTIGSQSLSGDWYFAEGFTGDGYLTFISIMNPGNADANVTATFNLDGGSPVVKNLVVPAQSRRTIAAHDAAQGPGPDWAFGTKLTSSQPVVAQEVLVKPSENLAHGTIGSQRLADSWYFAEGFTGDGYLTFISLTNPGTSDANVTVTFNLDGAPPQVENIVVPANSRHTIPAHDATQGPGPGWAFGVVVTSDQPIVAQEVLVKPSESLAHGTIGTQLTADPLPP